MGKECCPVFELYVFYFSTLLVAGIVRDCLDINKALFFKYRKSKKKKIIIIL